MNQVRIAERIGVDPVIVLTEKDYQHRAIRSAAAEVLWADDRERAKKQEQRRK